MKVEQPKPKKIKRSNSTSAKTISIPNDKLPTDANNSKKRLRSCQQSIEQIENDQIVIAETLSTEGTTHECTSNIKSRPIRLKKIEVTTTLPETVKRQEKRIIPKIILKRSYSYIRGDIVLVKWPSYPYWPAWIHDISNNSFDVIFFGDHGRTAKVKAEQLYDFSTNMEYILKTLRSRQWKTIYMKAIREADIYAGIPNEKSILNKIHN